MQTIKKASVLAVLALTAACGSSDKDEPVTPDFQGVYTSTSQGALNVMAFSLDHHYLLMPTGCQAQSCTELGTWSYDVAAQSLELTEPISGSTRTIHVDVVATGVNGVASGGLLTKDDLTDPSQVLSGSGSQLNSSGGSQLNSSGGSQLNSSGGSQLNKGQSNLNDTASQLVQSIAKALLDAQQMQQNAAGGGQQAGGGAADPGNNNMDDNAKPAVKAECQVGIPTPETSADDLKAYWAQCPDGPLTPP